MNEPTINDQIAQYCVSDYFCCRCGGEKDRKATLIRYGAPFCSDECAERASDYTLDDGQQMLKHYDQSLDAMLEAKKRLNFNNILDFIENLREVVARDKGRSLKDFTGWPWMRRIVLTIYLTI